MRRGDFLPTNQEHEMRVISKSLLAGACALVLIAACARNDAPAASQTAAGDLAQAAKPGNDDYTPQVGQAGKDVVWVPTPQALVERMLDMAELTPQDYLVDLGSGDGITVIAAAKRGAKALGVEYNPDLVGLARQRAEAEGVSGRASFIQADIFTTDFSNADVVTLFLLPALNLKLRPILLDMKPGTRVVSNTFDMAEWQPDQTAEAGGSCTSYCKAMLWIVPAKVAGEWSLGSQRLVLQQTFQMLEGSLGAPNNPRPISDARMDGREIRFTVGADQYVGDVDGDRISGTINGRQRWTATRL